MKRHANSGSALTVLVVRAAGSGLVRAAAVLAGGQLAAGAVARAAICANDSVQLQNMEQ